MDLELVDKVALVTASSQGLGLATATTLANEGAKVIICSRSSANLEKAAKYIKETTGNQAILPIEVDLTRSEDIKQLIEKITVAYQQLDILVTNTAGPPIIDFEETNIEQWQQAYQQILNSCIGLIKHSLPLLRQQKSASILTITSFTAKEPKQHFVLSNTMRPAVLGLTKSLSKELGQFNITVNSILPGYTLTNRLRELFKTRAAKNNTTVEAEIDKISTTIPLQRLGTPEEFAKAACFLVSPAASYITGTALVIDGGVSGCLI